MFRKLSLVLVSCLVVFSLGVNALGLGEIKLESGLNQPLKAEIELFSPEGMSEYEVAASLASMAEFEKAGIDYFGYLKNLRFKTVRRQGDVLVVEVTSRQPIKEPFLNFLVELNWPKGRMLREYTLLLDPPVFSESSASTVNQAKSAPKSNVSNSAKPSVSQPSASSPFAEPAQAYSGNSYGPVGSNETLWRISTKVRPAGATIHQTLVALYRANPQAFLNNDINLLKKGAVLNIPSAEDVAATPHRAALQDVVARTRSNYNETILDAANRKSSGSQVTRGEDRLRLAAPGKGSGSSGSALEGKVSDLQSQLARSKEASATLQAENEELRRKLQDALGKIEKSSGAVNVNSSEGVALANQGDVFANPEKPNKDNAMDEGDDSQNPADVSKANDNPLNSSLENNESPANNSAGDNAANPVSDNSASVPVDQNAQVAEKKPVNSFNTAPPKQDSGSFLDDPLMLYGGVGLLVVLLGAFFVFWRMRQRMSDDEFQDDLVVSAQGAGFDTESIDMPEVGDDLLDDLDSEDMFEEESSAEADPLGEADIYIAYGKYDQAENLLMTAIEADPDRTDLKVKLLECFAETKDQGKFDAVENQFSDIWQEDAQAAAQVAELKAKAWPAEESLEDDFELPSTDEIFGDEEVSGGSDDLDDFSLDDLDTESEVSLDDDFDSKDISGEEESFDTDELDFDLDDDSGADVSLEGSNEIEDDLSLDDDLLSLDSEKMSEESFDLDDDFSLDDEPSLDDEVSLDDSSNDLDLDLGEGDDDLGLDLDGDLDGDFDLGDDDGFDDDMMDGADEASTKLDLARAYIDMGDTDGAKEILNEVIEEGSDAHKEEAKSLLAKI